MVPSDAAASAAPRKASHPFRVRGESGSEIGEKAKCESEKGIPRLDAR